MRQGTELKIDFTLLAENYLALKKLAPKNEVIFMVKANAYGHGIIEVSNYASNELGINRLGVASLGEAIYLREKSKIESEIWVFSDTELTSSDINHSYQNKNIIPVISSKRLLLFYLNSTELKSVPIVLKFDTGMNRLGIPYSEVDDVLQLLKDHNRLEVLHIMTHFASSFLKLKKGDKTHQQYEKFLNIKKKFDKIGISFLESSCSNSGAIEQGFGIEETHIRPGLMMYGPRSVGSYKKEDAMWDGKTISSLKTKILKVQNIKKGMPVGYGGHVCHSDGVLVFLPVGYGDGILTYYSGLKLNHNGKEGQILGRINMDLIAVFFKDLSDNDFSEGEDFVLWSHNQEDVVDLANQVKSIPYQVFTAITHRVPKHFKYQ